MYKIAQMYDALEKQLAGGEKLSSLFVKYGSFVNSINQIYLMIIMIH